MTAVKKFLLPRLKAVAAAAAVSASAIAYSFGLPAWAALIIAALAVPATHATPNVS